MMYEYLIKSSLFLLLLYPVYWWILRNESNHQVRRIVGLACVIFSAAYVLLPSDFSIEAKQFPAPVQALAESTEFIQDGLYEVVKNDSFDMYSSIYLVGVSIVLLRSIGGFASLFLLFLKSSTSTAWGFRVVAIDGKMSPFTFFNLLFIGKSRLNDKDIDVLIMHEQVHQRQLHSLDMLLLEFLTIIFWFNPVIWLFRRDIKAEHEFLADEQVLTKGVEKQDYQDLLFRIRTGISFQSGSYFSKKTSLNKRFKMMENKKSNSKFTYLRIAALPPIIALIALAISFLPLDVNGQSDATQPDFVIFSEDGEVDLDKGIDAATGKLFIRVKQKQGDPNILKYMISESTATLVENGKGIGSVKSNEVISLAKIRSANNGLKSGSLIVIEIKEYKSKDEQDNIVTTRPEKGIFLKVPII